MRMGQSDNAFMSSGVLQVGTASIFFPFQLSVPVRRKQRHPQQPDSPVHMEMGVLMGRYTFSFGSLHRRIAPSPGFNPPLLHTPLPKPILVTSSPSLPSLPTHLVTSPSSLLLRSLTFRLPLTKCCRVWALTGTGA